MRYIILNRSTDSFGDLNVVLYDYKTQSKLYLMFHEGCHSDLETYLKEQLPNKFD